MNKPPIPMHAAFAIPAGMDADTLPDSAALSRLGEAILPWLAAELAQMEGNCPVQPVLPWQPPAEGLAALPEGFPEHGLGESAVLPILQRYAKSAHHLHQPRYIGHQVCPPLPLAALAEMVAALFNNSAAVYEMAPVGTLLETRLVEWYCRLLGFGAKAGGIVTSGGSLGNFTALLAARQAGIPGDVWQNGYDVNRPKPAVLVSAQAHYCIQRAVQMMGLGAQAAIKVPVDDAFRMDIDALKAGYETARHQGRQVFAVCASACSTATGSFDPLEAIADFCAEHGIWLHVDAAHGGAFLLSERYRSLLSGIERADSVVWDLHKMLRMPSLTSILAFRDRRHNSAAFLQEASYLFSGKGPEEEWYNLGQRMVECTKPVQGLKAYLCLMAYGTAYFADYVTRMIDTARAFADELKRQPDFELAVEPACNIVCFRYLPEAMKQASPDEQNRLQETTRSRLVESGAFYITQTVLDGIRYLRCTLINPKTDAGILEQLLAAIRQA